MPAVCYHVYVGVSKGNFKLLIMNQIMDLSNLQTIVMWSVLLCSVERVHLLSEGVSHLELFYEKLLRQVFLQNSQENTCNRVFLKLQTSSLERS